MNIETGLNNNQDYNFQEVLSNIKNPEEKLWINEAVEYLNQEDKDCECLKKLSGHIKKLNEFTPDQIVNLVYRLDSVIRNYFKKNEVANYLSQQGAALIVDKSANYHSHFLEKSNTKKLAIDLVIESVKKGVLAPINRFANNFKSKALDELKKYEIDLHSIEGQQALIEIAKLAAQQDGGRTSEFIKNYGIEATKPAGQQGLIEIAKLAAQKNGGGTSEFIKNYGIEATTPAGQQALIEIAKLAAQNDGEGTSKHIKNYGIEATTPAGQQGLIEIAKLAAQQNGGRASKFIKNYGIEASTPAGQQALIEIAKLAAQQNGGRTSEFIKNYGIEATTPAGQQALIEIAKLAAHKDGGGTSEFIKNYGIEASTPAGQQTLIEIAKLAAHKDGGGTSEFIKNYGVEATTPAGQQALIEIAKMAAQQDGWGTSQYIKNYGIEATRPEGQQALIEIAKLAAQQCGSGASKFIKEYGIDASSPAGQQAMIDIAKLAAQQKFSGTSEFIKNYGIDASSSAGQKALIDIAKFAAQSNGALTSEFIKNYGIEATTPAGQQALIEIAKLAAEQNGEETSYYIKNYGIEASTPAGQQGLIKIAELAAQKDGQGTSKYIEKYGIEASTPAGQQALIEVAKLAAQQNGGGTSFYIKNYGIVADNPAGQQVMIEIAKLAAQQEGWGTSEYIKNYGIEATRPEGQQALIEIAKLAAQQCGSGASKFIKEYGIDASSPAGQQALIEIAKLAAQQNGGGTSEFIKNYGIEATTPAGQQGLIEIAKLAAQKTPIYTLLFLKKYSFEIDSDEGKLRFKELCNHLFICLVKQSISFNYYGFLQNLDEYANKINGNGVDTYQVDLVLFKKPLEKLKNKNVKEALEEGISEAASLLKSDSSFFNWVQNRVSNIPEDKEKIEFLNWWFGLVLVCSSREDLKQLYNENGPLFDKISALPVDMRKRFTCEMIGSLDAKNNVVDALKKEFINESFIHKMAVLPRDLRIAVTDLFLQACAGRQAELLRSLKQEAKELVHAQLTGFILSQFPVQGQEVYLKVIKETLSDRKFRINIYQQALWSDLIAMYNSRLDESSKIALLDKIFTKSLVDDRLKALKLTIDILNFKREDYLKEVKDLKGLKSVLEQLFVDKCKIKIEDFSTKYEGTIGHWRSKECLLTYAAKHVENKRVLPYFQAFLTSVLQGTFKETRYAVNNNPHLAEIQKNHPEIFEKWKSSAHLNEDEINAKSSGKAVSIEQSVIKTLQQAVENRHLGLEQQDILFPILSACMAKWDLLQGSLDEILMQLAPLSNRKLSEEEIVQKQKLQLQKQLLEIMQNPEDLKNKLNILKGIKIKGFDQALSPFYKDIKDAIKLIDSSENSAKEALKVIDSDEPNDFLLMGTEVLNSCQNVNGSASLNVGVLGYACDGKHRLALVCDPSGKIVARSVLRLLIDAQGKPVIFQERMYVADANPEYPTLLKKIALKKAKFLGVPLVVSPTDFEKEQAKPYPCAIKAKDKPVPFEYVDALGGLQSGPYQISQALHIQ